MLTLRNLLAMRSPLRLAAMATIMAILQARPSLQQTTSKCNPTEQSCPADPALGSSVSVDFSSGSSTAFTAQGNPTYGSGGVSLTVAKSGDSPQLASKWYIMFGHVEITLKAAPGAGIVSSSVLLSDDLDEIDWEWLGAEDGQVQSNYFGKGQTTTYDRAATHAVSDSQGSTHQYTIDWTEDRIEWQIDGNTVRTLNANDANGQYPQTPMQFKFGAWSGGDPSNPPGTIQWAHGPTDYSKAPFTMLVESISVTDYSTGTQYKYGDMSGSYSSIQAVGGKISGNSNGASDSDSAAPAVTTTSNGNFVTLASSPTATTYPGLPSGWTVNSSGKVVPPSAAPVSKHLAVSFACCPPASAKYTDSIPVDIPTRLVICVAGALSGGLLLGIWV